MLISLLAAVAFGCKSGIKEGETYYSYKYDARTDSFIKMGSHLTFGENFETFEYSFGAGDLSFFGSVEHTDCPDSYIISCGEDVLTALTERYRKSLLESGATDSELELFDVLAESLTPQTQYFVHEGYFFSGDSVELYHEAGDDSDSFEGLYNRDDGKGMVKFRGGYVYTENEAGEYVEKEGRYTVSRGILTLVSLNKDGSDRYENGILYRKRYLMAKITLSEESTLIGTSFDEQMESSAFIKAISARKSEYAGKTITVLSEQFFSKEM